MSRLNRELAGFCAAWALLVIAMVVVAGWGPGLVAAIVLFLAITAGTATVLTRSGDLALERRTRWTILGVAALGLAFYAAAG